MKIKELVEKIDDVIYEWMDKREGTKIEKIYSFFRFTIVRLIEETYSFFHRDIPYGIENLIVWFKTIWTDRDWDYIFLFYILKLKLSRMEKLIREHGKHLDSDLDARRIKRCVIILDRLIKDEYQEKALERHDKKWGNRDYRFEKIPGTNCSKLEIDIENATTDELKEQERQEFLKYTKFAWHVKQKDIEILFNTMKKHIFEWWD